MDGALGGNTEQRKTWPSRKKNGGAKNRVLEGKKKEKSPALPVLKKQAREKRTVKGGPAGEKKVSSPLPIR